MLKSIMTIKNYPVDLSHNNDAVILLWSDTAKLQRFHQSDTMPGLGTISQALVNTSHNCQNVRNLRK